MKATLRLVEVELPRALIKREVYVTAIAVSERSQGAVPLSIHPRTGEEAEPGVATDAVVTSPPEASVITEPHGVSRRHPLKADVVLYEGDPGAWLVVRGAVMESDGGFRAAGARLDLARHAVDGTGLGRALVVGLGAPGVAASLAVDAAGTVADLLSRNGDDVLAAFEVRLDSVTAYRAQPGSFIIEVPGCKVHLEWNVEGLPADDAPLETLVASREQLDKVVQELKAGNPGTAAAATPIAKMDMPRPFPPEGFISEDLSEPAPAEATTAQKKQPAGAVAMDKASKDAKKEP